LLFPVAFRSSRFRISPAMKCDKCDQKATVFLTQFIDGNMKKVCLCEQCATEQGVTDPMGFSLAEALMGDAKKNDSSDSPVDNTVECPTCRFKLDDLRKVGRLGCPDCYKVFYTEIHAMLPNMHTNVVHTGKIPEGLVEVQLRTARLQELQELLKAAIVDEDYEAAATLRDEISEASGTLELKKENKE